MLRAPLALALLFALSGCCSSRRGLSEAAACSQYRDEAKRGWRNARDPDWPAQPQPPLESSLRVGMTASEVHERLGAPTKVVRREREEEAWTYQGEAPLVVTFRAGEVVGWTRRSPQAG